LTTTEDAVHGERSVRAGWHLDRPSGSPQVLQRTSIPLDANYVLSVYLKADREDVPVTISFRDRTRRRGGLTLDREVTVGTEWRRYALQLPLKEKGLTGYGDIQIGLSVNGVANILADAVQLEKGSTPTDFQVDPYRAVDIGPEYSREAVLGEE
jgi:hypothetical protein